MYDDLESFADSQDLLNVVIDTPLGSAQKYKWDREHHLFKLGHTMPSGMVFPFNFGFVPGTRGADGDELDCLVLTEQPLALGVLVQVRCLGIIEARQAEGPRRMRNDRLLGVPVTKLNKPPQRSLRDVDPERLRQFEQFLKQYNRVYGREFRIVGRRGPAAAKRLVQAHRA
jgi:inorganic pyrophosphatase